MSRLPVELACPSYSNCKQAGSFCPPDDEFKEGYMRQHPLILSEELCLRALADHTGSLTDDPNQRMFNDIDLGLETALAYSRHNTTEAQRHLSDVASKLSIVDNMPMQELSHKHHRIRHAHMRVLDAFMPAFTDRVNGDCVRPESAAAVHASLCNHLRDFSTNYIDKPPQLSKIKIRHLMAARAEHEVLALMTRPSLNRDYFPFPALAHEEASHQARLNHDLYVVIDGKKIPIQVKLTKQSGRYDNEQVIVISRDRIFNAMRQSEYSQHLYPEGDSYYSVALPPITSPSITELLLIEQRTGSSDSASISMLNLASAYIITRINELSLKQERKTRSLSVA